MTKICGFGKEIKKKLVDINQSQEWLIQKVKEETGLYFDSGYLHKILRGELTTPGIISSISKILNLPTPK
ncbi:MAG: XRE family transcriptional regulator [Oscillospiraceae bacterium]|jgi:hypothetical protein